MFMSADKGNCHRVDLTVEEEHRIMQEVVEVVQI